MVAGFGVQLWDVVLTQRLLCSSFLVLIYFLLRAYNILPKKELHSSLWVGCRPGDRVVQGITWEWEINSQRACSMDGIVPSTARLLLQVS